MSYIYLYVFLVGIFSNFQTSHVSKIDGEYIGGLKHVKELRGLTYKKRNPGHFVIVNTSAELVSALSKAKKGDAIFLPANKTFDLSLTRRIGVPEGITLFSDRGKNGSPGALVFTNNMSASPLLITQGSNIKISGIRLRGPDGRVTNARVEKKIDNVLSGKDKSKLTLNRIRAYTEPNSNCILVQHPGIEIENCEIYNWSYAGVFINASGYASIHHSYIHHNQRSGLGYGVYIDVGSANIRGNVFDFNRHAIAGSGRVGTSYTADYNICLANSTNQGHVFDMHGGADRKDDTNIAGDKVSITNNVFYAAKAPVIKIRGIPLFPSQISNNTFIPTNNKTLLSLNVMIAQSGGRRGNLEKFNNKLLW